MTHVELARRPQQTNDMMYGRDKFIDKIESSPFAAQPPDIGVAKPLPISRAIVGALMARFTPTLLACAGTTLRRAIQ